MSEVPIEIEPTDGLISGNLASMAEAVRLLSRRGENLINRIFDERKP